MKRPLSGLLAVARGPVHVAALAYIGAAGLAGVAFIGGVMLTPLGQDVQEAVAPAGELVQSVPPASLPALFEVGPVGPAASTHPASLATSAPLVVDMHIDEAPQHVITNPADAVSAAAPAVATLARADVSASPRLSPPRDEPVAAPEVRVATVATPTSLPAQTPAATAVPTSAPQKEPAPVRGSKPAQAPAKQSAAAKAPPPRAAQPKAAAAAPPKAAEASPSRAPTPKGAPKAATLAPPRAPAPKATTPAESRAQGPRQQPAKAPGKGK